MENFELRFGTTSDLQSEKRLFHFTMISYSMHGRASRWDTYLLRADDQIHWFSTVNSLMIVLFLSSLVAMIMLRTLYRDISKYNQLETQEEAQEETG